MREILLFHLRRVGRAQRLEAGRVERDREPALRRREFSLPIGKQQGSFSFLLRNRPARTENLPRNQALVARSLTGLAGKNFSLPRGLAGKWQGSATAEPGWRERERKSIQSWRSDITQLRQFSGLRNVWANGKARLPAPACRAATTARCSLWNTCRRIEEALRRLPPA